MWQFRRRRSTSLGSSSGSDSLYFAAARHHHGRASNRNCCARGGTNHLPHAISLRGRTGTGREAKTQIHHIQVGRSRAISFVSMTLTKLLPSGHFVTCMHAHVASLYTIQVMNRATKRVDWPTTGGHGWEIYSVLR